MSRLYELEKWKDHEEWVWPCDCGGCGHYLRAVWDVEDAEWRYIEIDYAYAPLTIREKIRGIITILRGRFLGHSGIILNDKAVASLKEFINSH